MATRSVRFDFNCENRKLAFRHEMPAELITSNVAEHQKSSAYMTLFVRSLEPIMNEHERACFEASAPNCGLCGEPKVKVLLTPMSWLHNVGDPFINVWVSPICAKGKCEIEERGHIEEAMRVLGEAAELEGENGDINLEELMAARAKKRDGDGKTIAKKVLVCKICGKVEGARQCTGCKQVAYCGKEHQRADWRVHKRVCTGLAGPNGERVNVM